MPLPFILGAVAGVAVGTIIGEKLEQEKREKEERDKKKMAVRLKKIHENEEYLKINCLFNTNTENHTDK
ncbi:hypothetical protein [Helicobacter felis]|uniref:hypothetical protein n=1 Tax=Helicobacter felis TaxID=214 RepID=UPI000CEF0E26|nr:hypothetical protein [Helicobacter felis]